MSPSSSLVTGEYGQGRVICFSPHPEYTEALKSMILRALKWAAKRPVEWCIKQLICEWPTCSESIGHEEDEMHDTNGY